MVASARSAPASRRARTGGGGRSGLRLSVAVGGVALAGRRGGDLRRPVRLARGRRRAGRVPDRASSVRPPQCCHRLRRVRRGRPGLRPDHRLHPHVGRDASHVPRRARCGRRHLDPRPRLGPGHRPERLRPLRRGQPPRRRADHPPDHPRPGKTKDVQNFPRSARPATTTGRRSGRSSRRHHRAADHRLRPRHERTRRPADVAAGRTGESGRGRRRPRVVGTANMYANRGGPGKPRRFRHPDGRRRGPAARVSAVPSPPT